MYKITTQHGTVWKSGYACRWDAEQAAMTNRNPHIRLTIEPSGACRECGKSCHADDDICGACDAANEAHEIDDLRDWK